MTHLHALILFSKTSSAFVTSAFLRATSSLKRSFAARRLPWACTRPKVGSSEHESVQASPSLRKFLQTTNMSLGGSRQLTPFQIRKFFASPPLHTFRTLSCAQDLVIPVNTLRYPPIALEGRNHSEASCRISTMRFRVIL